MATRSASAAARRARAIAPTLQLAARLYAGVAAAFTDAEVAAAPFARLAGGERPTRGALAFRGAQLLHAAQDWPACAAAFAAIAADPGAPHATEAAYGAALCQLGIYDAAHPGSDRAGLGVLPRGAALEPEQLAARGFTATEQGWLDAIDAQRCALTVSPNAASRAHGSRLRFARARTYLDAHRWAEAAAAFRELARDPQAPDAAAAAPLYLEAFYAASQAAHPAHACGATIAAEVDALLAQHCAGGARPAACAALTAIQADAATLPR